MFKIIQTREQDTYVDKFNELLVRHFSNPNWTYDPATFEKLRHNPFFILNMGLEDEKIVAYASMMLTTKQSADDLIAGKIHEHEVTPYPQGGNEPGYLFWLALIFEKRHTSPYLMRNAFKELEMIMRKWKINISHVYAIAYTPLSERIMRHHKFQKVGMYEGQYPIMMVKVTDNPYLAAFIPYINTSSETPWYK